MAITAETRPRLRILTTNDFFCSFEPQPTSYGSLPGGNGLRATADALRTESRASIWIDVGDFAQGGPLSRASDGMFGFHAADLLGFDVAVAGNHEFDWGRAQLSRLAREVRFPLLAANDPIELPGTAIREVGGVTVGVVGLSQLDEPRPGPFWGIDDWPAALRRSAKLVLELADELRAGGADLVVAAIHAGVELRYLPGGRCVSLPGDIDWLCEQWRGAVDIVLGAHTLGRTVGRIAGVPYLQPWAYGAEIAFADLLENGDISLGVARPSEAGGWDGPGAETGDVLGATICELREPLIQRPGRENAIAGAAAQGIARLSGAGTVLVFPWEFCTQPPVDGVFAYLAAGPVSEWHLQRLVPWTGETPDAVFLGEVSNGELGEIERALPTALGPPARAGVADAGGSLAVSGHFAPVIDHWLGRPVTWERQPFGVERALRSELGDA